MAPLPETAGRFLSLMHRSTAIITPNTASRISKKKKKSQAASITNGAAC